MKTKLYTFITCLGIFIISISNSYAACGGCGASFGFFSSFDIAPIGCGSRSPELGCNCADPGVYYNDCISRAEYCEAFGNIGAR